MAEEIQDSLLREIDEEIRQEKYLKLWKKYGNYAIAAVIALVVGVAGYQGWRAWDISQRTERSERFMAAVELAVEGKTADAQAAFKDLAAGSGGYAMLSRLREASLAAEAGDKAQAAAIYREVAASSAPQTYRDLATVLGVLQEIDTGDPAALRERLRPLLAPTSAWRFTARELSALLAHRAGQTGEAQAIFKELSADPEAPQGIRTRAAELLAAIG